MAFEHLEDNWDDIMRFHESFDPTAVPITLDTAEPPISSSSREHWLNTKRNQIKKFFGVIAVSGVGLVACISQSDDNSGKSGDTLPQITSVDNTTTTELTTTTTTQVSEQDCSLGAIVIEQGETLTEIAKRCGVTVPQLALWNNITDLNSIEAGKYLYVAEPPVLTTTSVVETTVLPQTVPETLPPTTQPIAPVTSSQKPSNDGVLRNPECAAIGGVLHSFVVGETVTSYLVKLGFTSHDAAKLIANTTLLRDYRIANIYEDNPTDNADLRECVPTREALKLRYGV